MFFYKNRDPKFLNDTKPNTPFHFPVKPLAAAVQDKILLFESVPTSALRPQSSQTPHNASLLIFHSGQNFFQTSPHKPSFSHWEPLISLSPQTCSVLSFRTINLNINTGNRRQASLLAHLKHRSSSFRILTSTLLSLAFWHQSIHPPLDLRALTELLSSPPLLSPLISQS